MMLGPAVATLVGLVSVLMAGQVSWPLARGISGIAIGMLVALFIAIAIRTSLRWPTSVLASIVGAMVASFCAIASAEVYPPGSIEWMWKGGLYGAAFGIPVALLLSPIALIRPTRAGH